MPTTSRTVARLLGAAAMVAATLLASPAMAADKPAPTTAEGYARMFAATVAKGEAGAGDVSLSAPLPDGRVVWLFGDTFSPRNGMVHSSAIVQTGGRLHVSDHGAQVLPNGKATGGRKVIHWIEAATATGSNRLTVTAAPMSVGSANGWDFHRADARSRTATVRVTPAGDVRFVRWTGWTTAPAPFADFDYGTDSPGHVTYEHRAHPWADIDGGVLMTHANNHDLGGKFLTTGRGKAKRIDYAAYAPTYYAGTGIETRAAQ